MLIRVERSKTMAESASASIKTTDGFHKWVDIVWAKLGKRLTWEEIEAPDAEDFLTIAEQTILTSTYKDRADTWTDEEAELKALEYACSYVRQHEALNAMDDRRTHALHRIMIWMPPSEKWSIQENLARRNMPALDYSVFIPEKTEAETKHEVRNGLIYKTLSDWTNVIRFKFMQRITDEETFEVKRSGVLGKINSNLISKTFYANRPHLWTEYEAEMLALNVMLIAHVQRQVLQSAMARKDIQTVRRIAAYWMTPAERLDWYQSLTRQIRPERN